MMASAAPREQTDDAQSKTQPPFMAPAGLPDEEERLKILEDMMGGIGEASNRVPDAITALVNRSYDRHVLPLVQAHWPASLEEGSRLAEGRKLRFLACRLYAAAPYIILFCSPSRPLPFRIGTTLGVGLGLSRKSLTFGGEVSLRILGAISHSHEHRLIVLIAAFIATVDHAFDHCMDDCSPAERGKKMRALLDGQWQPSESGPLRLTRALQEAMESSLRPIDEAPYHAAIDRVREWCKAEVEGMTGGIDPDGLCFRQPGVEGTIDGLIFPVIRHAGEDVRLWMYDVSWFVQMMDDWLDVEKDVLDVRETPVISGRWTLSDIQSKWEDTVTGIEKLAFHNGPRGDNYVQLVRDSYVFMMREVMRAMAHGLAA